MVMLDFPEFRQSFDYDCGAKAVQAMLAYYGIDVDEEEIIKLAGTNRKSGTSISGVVRVLEKYNLKYHSGELEIDKIKSQLAEGHPVILILQAWTKDYRPVWDLDWKDGHYVVAIGYDDKKVYFEDPYSINRTYLTYNELEKRWHNQQKRKKYVHYAISVYGRKPRYPTKARHMA